MERGIRIGFLSVLTMKSEREKLSGVLRFASEHAGVSVEEFNPVPFPARERTRLMSRWNPDGVILALNDLEPFIPHLDPRIPIVQIDRLAPGRPVGNVRALVQPDETPLARFVAEFFLRRGFRQFAYVGYRDHPRSAHREKKFRQRLLEGGHDAQVFRTDWTAPRNRVLPMGPDFDAWLLALPRPCALFAYWDYQGQQVLEACQRLGLKVPDQISVLSIDNEESVCENTRPTLSSIELDFQAGGYRAASRLFDLLAGGTGTVPFTEIGYGMSRLVERRSTSALTGSARIVAAAQDLIRRRAAEGISPSDVAAELNLSPRLLQLRFRETLGRTPLEEIQRVRLETVCDLLRTTRLPLATIAARSGYATLHHLQNIFTRARGCSMTAWRRGPVQVG